MGSGRCSRCRRALRAAHDFVLWQVVTERACNAKPQSVPAADRFVAALRERIAAREATYVAGLTACELATSAAGYLRGRLSLAFGFCLLALAFVVLGRTGPAYVFVGAGLLRASALFLHVYKPAARSRA